MLEGALEAQLVKRNQRRSEACSRNDGHKRVRCVYDKDEKHASASRVAARFRSTLGLVISLRRLDGLIPRLAQLTQLAFAHCEACKNPGDATRWSGDQGSRIFQAECNWTSSHGLPVMNGSPLGATDV